MRLQPLAGSRKVAVAAVLLGELGGVESPLQRQQLEDVVVAELEELQQSHHRARGDAAVNVARAHDLLRVLRRVVARGGGVVRRALSLRHLRVDRVAMDRVGQVDPREREPLWV
eukprot:7210257-Prymnesium_polylepis.1